MSLKCIYYFISVKRPERPLELSVLVNRFGNLQTLTRVNLFEIEKLDDYGRLITCGLGVIGFASIVER